MISANGVEDVEQYRPGGFHPISIGNTFCGRRYKVVHKLGFGGSSTVWLARDQHSSPGVLVALKAMHASTSTTDPSEIPEIVVPETLQAAHSASGSFQAVTDHFVVDGPNGTHHFLVSPFAGPSVLAMSDSPGRVAGSRRLRGDLARSVARQTAATLHYMHSAGFVHGDLTTSNILFRVAEHVLHWSDSQVYAHFGVPETEEVRTRGGEPCSPYAPPELVAPIDNATITDASLLHDSVVLIDFGQSYAVASPPKGHQPGTAMHYLPPETRFEGRAGLEADVWNLGCAIFEIRAGAPLFEPFFGSDADILRQTVEVLGRLPDPWWRSFRERALWFEENGQPRSAEAQQLSGALVPSTKSSIQTKLRSIGMLDDPPSVDEGPMIEKPGVTLDEEEVGLLGDLLAKMLRYRPEERLSMREVIYHPWFTLEV
ncbi:kinase-like protein [Daedalea quercina L-15889]|uniref:Kinase-like protein n=1 Tax=Daedalea quercina L-15889 TaxID=1314783 RepID=A0A165QN45_9APHY|nr:kinase-like protein [Daedalea quercina L-15889]